MYANSNSVKHCGGNGTKLKGEIQTYIGLFTSYGCGMKTDRNKLNKKTFFFITIVS